MRLIAFGILFLFLSACVRSIPGSDKPTFPAPLDLSFTEIPLLETGVMSPEPLDQMKTPAPPPSFLGASVIEVGYFDNFLLIVIQVPAGIVGKFEAEAGGERYRCLPQDIFPDRLYCYGKISPDLDVVHLLLYAPGAKDVLFEADITVPSADNIKVTQTPYLGFGTPGVQETIPYTLTAQPARTEAVIISTSAPTAVPIITETRTVR